MPDYLIPAAIFMTLALVFYSTGVWAERIARDLRSWHVAAFWLGLACDAWGSWLMNRMVVAGTPADPVHGITGTAAFLLMAGHAIWATVVVIRGSTEARSRFHRYSIAVWVLWLVPYLGGMVAGMARGA